MSAPDATDTAATSEIDDLLPFADPAFRDDPYPYYDRVRALTPVYESPAGVLALTRYRDVAELIRHPATSALELDFGVGWRFHDAVLGQDMPDHLRLRRVFSKWFSSERVKVWAEDTQARIDTALRAAEARGGVIDLVDDIAFPATFGTSSRMFGIPVQRTEECRHHVYVISLALMPSASEADMERGEASFVWFNDYIDELVDEQRREPTDGMLATFIAAQDDGTISHAELVASMMVLFAVGFLDNTHLITNGVMQMLWDPSLRTRYLADPAIRPNAVLEILRQETSEQFVVRALKDDVEIEGITLPAQSVVMMLLGAANRDPEMFPNPAVIDFDRPNVTKQIGFGGGIHACIGFALARAQGEVGVTSILGRFPDLALAGDVEYGHTEFLRVIRHLPVTLGRSAD